MTKLRGQDGDAECGVTVGGATGFFIVCALYTLIAPTDDIRARIPLLLQMSGGLLTLLTLLGFWSVAVLGLLAIRGLSRRSVASAFIPSLGYLTLLLSERLTELVPEFDTLGAALAVIVASGIVTSFILHKARSRNQTIGRSFGN